MSFFSWLGQGSVLQGLGSLGQLGLNVAQFEAEKKNADRNFQLQQDSFDYQKQLNDLQMQREDTAVQRRAEDLKAAGINPILAGGGSATSQALSAPSAPQRDVPDMSKINLMQMAQDFANQKVQRDNSIKHTNAIIKNLDSQSSLNNAKESSVLLDTLFNSDSFQARKTAKILETELMREQIRKNQIGNAFDLYKFGYDVSHKGESKFVQSINDRLDMFNLFNKENKKKFAKGQVYFDSANDLLNNFSY